MTSFVVLLAGIVKFNQKCRRMCVLYDSHQTADFVSDKSLIYPFFNPVSFTLSTPNFIWPIVNSLLHLGTDYHNQIVFGPVEGEVKYLRYYYVDVNRKPSLDTITTRCFFIEIYKGLKA